MSAMVRNNVRVSGDGAATMVFAHGLGCDQTMWRYLAPAFEDRFRVIVFDLVGSGGSHLPAYDRARYASLQGHADDLIEILDECAAQPVVYVGHSVSAMIGMLATIAAPARFASQIMIGPSPSYIDADGYTGGFSRADIEELLAAMEINYLGWSSNLAPAVMGAPERPELAAELAQSFYRHDPAIAKHFARVTFLSDHRADLARSTVPALILQSSGDIVAPPSVGDYLHRHLPNSSLEVIEHIGHYPHLSAASDCSQAIQAFLARQGAAIHA